MAKVLGVFGKCQVRGSIWASVSFKRQKVVYLLPNKNYITVGKGVAANEENYAGPVGNVKRKKAYIGSPSHKWFIAKIRAIASVWKGMTCEEKDVYIYKNMRWKNFVKIKFGRSLTDPPRSKPIRCEYELFDFDADTKITAYNFAEEKWQPVGFPLPKSIDVFNPEDYT